VTFSDPQGSKSTGVVVGDEMFKRRLFGVVYGGQKLDRFFIKLRNLKKFIKLPHQTPRPEN
jgi:hypothetical protein